MISQYKLSKCRKDTKCECCGNVIKKGEEYYVYFKNRPTSIYSKNRLAHIKEVNSAVTAVKYPICSKCK